MPRQTKRKINYQKALRDVAKSMVRLKRPERLLRMITRFIDREFGLTHTSLLVLDEKNEHFIFVDSKGRMRFPISLLKFEMNHPVVQWFKNNKRRHKNREDFLSRPLVERWQRDKASGEKNGAIAEEFSGLKKSLKDLKVELVVPGYYKGDLLGLLLLGNKTSQLPFTNAEISFFQILTQDCSMAVKTAQYHQSLIEQNQALAKQLKEIESLRKKEQDTYYEIMRSLAQEVHAKDPYTFGHVSQVERLGMMTARELGLDLTGKRKDLISAALVLHDVGKIGIPDHILKKPGPLTPEEWDIMKTHVDKGVKILEPLSGFKNVAEIIRCHHENYNGSGYPRGLKGDQIPMEARIVSVVDAFHAIVSHRCYDPARSVEIAFDELRRCAGSQFDPQVVDAFIRALERDMEKRGVRSFSEEIPPSSDPRN